MNVTKYITIAALISGFILSASASDMILTLDDGEDAILHEDKTWGYAKFSVFEGDQEDIYITVNGGKTLLLKTDGTWDYTTKEAPRKKSFQELPSVYANGTAKSSTLDAAVQAAKAQALDRTVARLTPYAKKSKLTNKYLKSCIKNEIGSSGEEVSYTKGWSAEAKITLSKLQVKHIVDCVETQIDMTPTEAAPEVKK